MNTIKFKQKLLECQMTQKDFAKAFGITYQGLWIKLERNAWSLQDIKDTKKILNLNDQEVKEIFEL